MVTKSGNLFAIDIFEGGILFEEKISESNIFLAVKNSVKTGCEGITFINS